MIVYYPLKQSVHLRALWIKKEYFVLIPYASRDQLEAEGRLHPSQVSGKDLKMYMVNSVIFSPISFVF